MFFHLWNRFKFFHRMNRTFTPKWILIINNNLKCANNGEFATVPNAYCVGYPFICHVICVFSYSLLALTVRAPSACLTTCSTRFAKHYFVFRIQIAQFMAWVIKITNVALMLSPAIKIVSSNRCILAKSWSKHGSSQNVQKRKGKKYSVISLIEPSQKIQNVHPMQINVPLGDGFVDP